MSYNVCPGLLATIAEVADLLAPLDLAALPELSSVQVTPDLKDFSRLDAAAQITHAFTNERQEIEAVRTWAGAIGGVLLLGDEHTDSEGQPFRRLSAVRRLPSGGLFEVWTHLRALYPIPGWSPDLILA